MYNTLTTVPADMGDFPPRIQVSYVDYNTLTTVPADMGDFPPRIQVIYVDYNTLTTVPADMGDFPPRIQVSYVDYGNKHWVSASDLYQLPGTLLKQPAQAVLCALAKVDLIPFVFIFILFLHTYLLPFLS